MIDHLMQFKSFKGDRIDLEFIEKRWARNGKKSNLGGGSMEAGRCHLLILDQDWMKE